MSVEVRAVAKYIRMSPQKVRLVADLVRGKDVQQALTVLQFTNRAAAKSVSRVIASAAANAEENYGLQLDDLYVAEIQVNEAPTLRRGRAGARGRYKPLLKRGSQISVMVTERAQA